MTKTLKIEEARKLLDELDPAMPDGFEVVAVARTPSPGQFVVKWRDPAEKEIYDDGVADMEGGDAANAYRFQPSYEYSYVWFNENPDGGGDVAQYGPAAAFDHQAFHGDGGWGGSVGWHGGLQ